MTPGLALSGVTDTSKVAAEVTSPVVVAPALEVAIKSSLLAGPALSLELWGGPFKLL